MCKTYHFFSKKSPNRSTKPESGDYKNLLKRKFKQSAPNQIWLRNFSRKVISWKISFKPDAELVISTFKKTYAKRNFPNGLMVHFKRFSQTS